MNLFHYQLSHWLTINKLKPTTIVEGDNCVQVITPSINFSWMKFKILMEKASLFHLEIDWMGKMINVTYLGASKCLSIWLETYTCVVKWVTQWIPFLSKTPFSRKSWNWIINFFFVFFKFYGWVQICYNANLH